MNAGPGLRDPSSVLRDPIALTPHLRTFVESNLSRFFGDLPPWAAGAGLRAGLKRGAPVVVSRGDAVPMPPRVFE